MTRSLTIFPAIQITEGKVVRLHQEPGAMTIFSNEPVDLARAWQEEGATWLHVVDLDGARRGQPVNTDVVLQIRQAVGLHVQVGGGLRRVEDIAHLLAQGIDRVVLGTAAVESLTLVRDLVEIWGEKIVVALDARDGQVATQGRTTGSAQTAGALAAAFAAAGARRLLVTDLARDGTPAGPDLAALAALQEAAGPAVGLIAAGGLTTLDHLRALRALGLEGAILDHALYSGALKLAAAIKSGQ